jgi:hypothetical protein
MTKINLLYEKSIEWSGISIGEMGIGLGLGLWETQTFARHWSSLRHLLLQWLGLWFGEWHSLSLDCHLSDPFIYVFPRILQHNIKLEI